MPTDFDWNEIEQWALDEYHLNEHVRQLTRRFFALEQKVETMSAQTDQENTLLDSINTTIQNIAAHQKQAFQDYADGIAAGKSADDPAQAAIMARLSGMATDLSNIDLAAVAADPGPTVVTVPGTPAPVTPDALPADTSPAGIAPADTDPGATADTALGTASEGAAGV